jgi:polyphosphate kinase 2 (PPK2 family)
LAGVESKQKKREVVEAPDASGKISRKQFEEELAKLQVELTRLQTWVKDKGARVIVVFEGRDTAGKGGVISRITARTSPRVFRHVALPAPSDREKTKSTSNATSRNSQRRARSSSSTARGTTGLESSESWASAPTSSTSGS